MSSLQNLFRLADMSLGRVAQLSSITHMEEGFLALLLQYAILSRTSPKYAQAAVFLDPAQEFLYEPPPKMVASAWANSSILNHNTPLPYLGHAIAHVGILSISRADEHVATQAWASLVFARASTSPGPSSRPFYLFEIPTLFPQCLFE